MAHAIRAAGISPIVALSGILLTHHLYQSFLPGWFDPLLNNQVAILTLCAGHAGIIGLWLNSRGRPNWSTLALMLAAIATAGAGYRSVGESTAGHVVVVLLFLLLGPSIWAEPISAGLSWCWRFMRSKKGLLTGALTIVAILWIALVTYNQLQNENYIRNWILIPLAIILGFAVSSTILWALLRLGLKYLAAHRSWIRGR